MITADGGVVKIYYRKPPCFTNHVYAPDNTGESYHRVRNVSVMIVERTITRPILPSGLAISGVYRRGLRGLEHPPQPGLSTSVYYTSISPLSLMTYTLSKTVLVIFQILYKTICA